MGGGLHIDCLLNICLCEAVVLPGGEAMPSLQSLARARRGNTPIAQRRVYRCVSLQLLCARVYCMRGHSQCPLAFFSAWLYTRRKP